MKVIVLSVVLSLGLGALLYATFGVEKTAYLDVNALYNSFDYQKEMTFKLDQMAVARKGILDSLDVDLRDKSIQWKERKEKLPELQDRYSHFVQLQERFETEYAEVQMKYEKQVWERLNSYVRNFGKMKNYDYIYGANGSGSIMYCDSTENITDQIIKYCNEKYAGN